MIALLSGSLGPADPAPNSVLYALIQYTTDRQAAMRWNELRTRRKWADQASHNRDHFERGQLEAKLIRDLVAQLQSGGLIAAGIWSGSGRSRECVPRDWGSGVRWTSFGARCRLDIERSSAKNFGSVVEGLVIFRRDDGKARGLGSSRVAAVDRDKGGRPPQYDRTEIVR